jgi:ATP-dependent DNA helicase RecG
MISQSPENPWTIPVTRLMGVGEQRARLLDKLGVRTVGDLMEHFPRDYINRRSEIRIDSLKIGERISFVGVILHFAKKRTRNAGEQFNVVVSDGIGSLLCTWFKAQPWIVDSMTAGKSIWVGGVVSEFNGRKQLVHPEFEVLEDDTAQQGFWRNRNILPVYALSGALKMGLLRNLMVQAFREFGRLVVEILPLELIERYRFTPRAEAMQKLHFPTEATPVEEIRKRFAYEELLYHQLMLARCNLIHHQAPVGNAHVLRKTLTTKLRKSLTFSLTNAQKRVINEIVADMTSPRQMHRLLQGDVGSGKTIVTLFAMLIAVENGFQAALMAPTELLAEQHFRSISRFLENQPEVKIILIKGGNYKGKREAKIAVAEGRYDIVIGTHALIQKDIRFYRLGFAAVDEQHRFGVRQRALLASQSDIPDVLHLSATPIPRSLAMTLFGDLEVSVIDELPPTRKPVITRSFPESRAETVFAEVRAELAKGRQVYIVCPLVEESEKVDLLDAETLYRDVGARWLPNIPAALLHGRMKPAEKDEIMQRFKEGDIRALVSTTVIEVGIDVANATVMVIWHAERFGLAQMHQLRGRVGRGAEQSYCHLIEAIPISAEGRVRIDTMVSCQDGFAIAEKDLEMRGAGDFFGERQAGMPAFRHADLVRDQEWLQLARRDAFALISADQELSQPGHEMVASCYRERYLSREHLFPY